LTNKHLVNILMQKMMDPISIFVLSLFHKATYEVAKAAYKEIWRKDIIDRVFDAYESAIEKWDPDNQTETDANDTFDDKIALLRMKILASEDSFGTDADTNDLLELFKNELLNDPIAYNWLNEVHWDSIQTQLNRIEKQISNLSSSNKPHQIIPDNFALFLNDNIKPNPYHISRNLTIAVAPDGENQNNPTDLASLIQHKKKIVILASAGMGKSEELKQTAIVLAEQKIKVPILISLCDYTGDKDIEFYLPAHWKNIPQNKLLLLLDGFDELEAKDILTFKRHLSNFTKTYSDIVIVVSTRTNFYYLPIEGNIETIGGFEAYFLQSLTHNDIVTYVRTYHQIDGQDFMSRVYENQFEDLVFNPFFLQVLIPNFKQNGNQFRGNRIDLLNNFIEERLTWDKLHFENAFDLNENKRYAFRLLRQIAFAIELLGQRKISSDNLHELMGQSEFELLKHCPVIKKEDGTENWKFEHNNFQELLCAEYIKELPFDKVLDLISYKDYAKIRPSWVNTISFLISLLKDDDKLFRPLIDWIVKNDSEILVKVEKERLSPELRHTIFTSIFNYYKELNIWIHSSKFLLGDLARFGQSNESIEFTLNEIINSQNSRRVRLNGISILGGFSLNDYPNANSIRDRLIGILQEENFDNDFIYSLIGALSDLHFNDKQTIDKLFVLFGSRKSTYVKSAMYSMINESNCLNSYVDYYIEGLKLSLKHGAGYYEEGEPQFMDETISLYLGIRKFNSKESLLRLTDFIIDNYQEIYDEFDFIQSYVYYINNCISLYQSEASIFDSMLKLLGSQYNWIYNGKIETTVSFFSKTKTQKKAFDLLLTRIQSSEEDTLHDIITLSYLIKENDIDTIITSYKQNQLTEEKLRGICWDIHNFNNSFPEKFLQKIQVATNIQFNFLLMINYEQIRQEKLQQSFNILFDIIVFKDECISVLGEKEKISKMQIQALQLQNQKLQSNCYNDSVLRLLRDFSSKNKSITKIQIVDLFNNENKLQNYIIQQIYFLLKKKQQVFISEKQKTYIQQWVDSNIEDIDFATAFIKKGNGTYSYKIKAVLCCFFIQKLNLNTRDDKLLSMLTFTFDEHIISFDYLVKRLPKDKIDQVVIDNIKYRIPQFYSIYYKHVKYAFVNQLSNIYSSVFSALNSCTTEPSKIDSIIDLYFQTNSDTTLIKELFGNFCFEAKTTCLKWLINRGELVYAQSTLLGIEPYISNKQDCKTINNLLITCGCLKGLENSIRWIDEYKESPFSQSGQGLTYFKDIETLPYFMQLVERGYDKKITTGHELDKMLPLVLDGVQHLALASKENFNAVCQNLQEFIQAKKGVLDEVEFLNATIERIKERFFQNYTPIYKIKDIRQMIREFAE